MQNSKVSAIDGVNGRDNPRRHIPRVQRHIGLGPGRLPSIRCLRTQEFQIKGSQVRILPGAPNSLYYRSKINMLRKNVN